MLFTVVILRTYEFFQESLVNVKLTHFFFILKDSSFLNTATLKLIILKIKCLKGNRLLNSRNVFY